MASFVRRSRTKKTEDKNISIYINEFQIVKDKQQRQHYKMLTKEVQNYLLFSEAVKKSSHERKSFEVSLSPPSSRCKAPRRVSFAGFTRCSSLSDNGCDDGISGQSRFDKKLFLDCSIDPAPCSNNESLGNSSISDSYPVDKRTGYNTLAAVKEEDINK